MVEEHLRWLSGRMPSVAIADDERAKSDLSQYPLAKLAAQLARCRRPYHSINRRRRKLWRQ